jgi:hypothetical protein
VDPDISQLYQMFYNHLIVATAAEWGALDWGRHLELGKRIHSNKSVNFKIFEETVLSPFTFLFSQISMSSSPTSQPTIAYKSQIIGF